MAIDFTPERFWEAIAQMERGAALTATEWGRDVEQQMRADARWTDRNGPSVTGLNARQSLKVEVEYLGGDQVYVVAKSDRESPRQWRGAPAPVGAFLELGTRFMDKYDVVWPTLTARAPDLKQRLESMLLPDF
jgi:hypothetical protein